MKNTEQKNEQQLPENNNNKKNGSIQQPGKQQERVKLDKEDAGGTGLGHRKDHGKEDRDIRKQQ